jgi:phage recombination protein Bet
MTSAIEAVDTIWTRERIDLVKRTVVPKGIPDDEFLLFIEQCKRSGLDPLIKEAYCVGRNFNFGTREKPQWGTKYEFQPSEAGMLARAHRFPDFEGIQAAAVYSEDEITMDFGRGTVVHTCNPVKRSGRLMGAWARVQVKGKLPVVVWLDLSGYQQQSPLWQKIPGTMVEKCARVGALRKAFPSAFGNLYIAEELPPEVAGSPVAAAVEVAPPAALPAPSPTLQRVPDAAPAQPVEAEVAPTGEPPTSVVLPTGGPPEPKTEAFDRWFEAQIAKCSTRKELSALALKAKGKVLKRDELNLVFMRRQGELNRAGAH